MSKADDPRIPWTREAVAFWNTALGAGGSPFGSIAQVTADVPGEELKALRRAVVLGKAAPSQTLDGVPGDLIIVSRTRR